MTLVQRQLCFIQELTTGSLSGSKYIHFDKLGRDHSLWPRCALLCLKIQKKSNHVQFDIVLNSFLVWSHLSQKTYNTDILTRQISLWKIALEGIINSFCNRSPTKYKCNNDSCNYINQNDTFTECQCHNQRGVTQAAGPQATSYSFLAHGAE